MNTAKALLRDRYKKLTDDTMIIVVDSNNA